MKRGFVLGALSVIAAQAGALWLLDRYLPEVVKVETRETKPGYRTFDLDDPQPVAVA